ncbi:MAG: hypothetical protein L3J50_12440 [Emcibacter sp.]|nr:hypothetical protein [Emcibacter sp.]
MANELGYVNAGIVKALLDEGWKGQDVAILFGVNSRAVSQVKSGEEYSNVKPDYNHGIPAEIFKIPKIAILNILGKEKVKVIYKMWKR